MLPRTVVLSYASTEVHQSLYRQSRETVTELHGCDAGFVRHRAQAWSDVRVFPRPSEEVHGCLCCMFRLAVLVKAMLTWWHSPCRKGTRGQLGRAVKAIDSKSIGVTRVSSSLTAVDAFRLRHSVSLDSMDSAADGGVVLRLT